MNSTSQRPRLENWAVVVDPYAAPEIHRAKLSGNVSNHPKHENGTHVITSRIVSANGRLVTTAHTEYELGQPCEEYLRWYKETYPDREIDLDNPIKFVD